MGNQKRVSWDELKEKMGKQDVRQEGVPGSKSFDSYAEKLEKTRNERLQAQEEDMIKNLKRVAGGKEKKKKDKKKDKKEKKLKRTAEGAVLAASDDDDSEEEDCLVNRYKNMKQS